MKLMNYVILKRHTRQQIYTNIRLINWRFINFSFANMHFRSAHKTIQELRRGIVQQA